MSSNIKYIAQQLGVSPSTVSRVINGKDRVSEKTREKVNAALKEFDYKPNEMARVLRGKRSRTIGIVVSDISNIFFAKIIKGAENAAMGRGYNILVCNTDSDPVREKENVNLLLSKHVSGIIMASVGFDTTFDDRKAKTGTPFVYLDNIPKFLTEYHSVSIDNFSAAKQLTEHLISCGHTRIAILAGALVESSGANRLEGWRSAMVENNLEAPERYIKAGAFTIESGFKCTEQLVAQKIRPTAILASNNNLAYGAILALRRHDYDVPGDLSLAAFDASDDTQLIVPKLTTINQPVMEYGRVAVELCLGQARHRKINQYDKVILPHTFVEGDSVAVLKKE